MFEICYMKQMWVFRCVQKVIELPSWVYIMKANGYPVEVDRWETMKNG